MATVPLPVVCTLSQFFDQNGYDYIIVGGGTAGMVLASRLSENPNMRIGVLEAGEAHLGDQHIASPAGMAQVLNNPDYDWCFRSTPQLGNNNKVHHVARGKGLGGSSCINFLSYCRPSRQDIDNWEKLGGSDWSWDRLLPYYQRSQRVAQGDLEMDGAQDSFAFDPHYHGDGPVATSFPSWRFPFEDNLLCALDETAGGVSRPADPCSGDHLGFYGTLSTIDRSGKPRRCDASTGYLKGIENRPNLKILPNALACRIDLSDESFMPSMSLSPTARGVVFSCEGQMYYVHARREIILACGSIKSPHLLELSGIGNPADLEAAGISLRVALPGVGENLQEHPMSALTYELRSSNMTLDSLFSDRSVFEDFMAQYTESGDGPLGGCMSLTGFLPYASCVDRSRLERTLENFASAVETQSSDIDAMSADMLRDPASASVQFTCVPANFNPEAGHGDLSRVMPGSSQGPCYTILVSSAYPLSRGSVHAATADPYAAPGIDLGLLGNDVDVDVIAAGIAFADKAFRSRHVSDQVARRVSPPASLNIDDPDEVRQYVKDNVLIFNHLLGTCAMEKTVDSRLRVKNVHGLRVVDASVIPVQMSGNIIATVYALAERAADLIKEDAGNTGFTRK
ncbi:hypothetical protein BJY04DRAFT_227177 [Aspergillus karnatakaensis]|uniref:GMC family oxidoreductase n=1 Tax=Aspergillus karnatakaensis TaxID=1810916 RepID=UPI003CCCF88B